MILAWAEEAWEDYLYWQDTDKKVLKRINLLVKDKQRDSSQGLGSPEALKHNWSGYWSRRIDREHRLVNTIKQETIFIAQCRYHY